MAVLGLALSLTVAMPPCWWLHGGEGAGAGSVVTLPHTCLSHS